MIVGKVQESSCQHILCENLREYSKLFVTMCILSIIIVLFSSTKHTLFDLMVCLVLVFCVGRVLRRVLRRQHRHLAVHDVLREGPRPEAVRADHLAVHHHVPVHRAAHHNGRVVPPGHPHDQPAEQVQRLHRHLLLR